MKKENNHVGRPTNEEIRKKRVKKALRFIIPLIIVVLLIIGVTQNVNTKKLSGSLSQCNFDSVKHYGYACPYGYISDPTKKGINKNSCYRIETDYVSDVKSCKQKHGDDAKITKMQKNSHGIATYACEYKVYEDKVSKVISSSCKKNYIWSDKYKCCYPSATSTTIKSAATTTKTTTTTTTVKRNVKPGLSYDEIRKLAIEKKPSLANLSKIDVHGNRIVANGTFKLESKQEFLFADAWFGGNLNNLYRILGTKINGNSLSSITFNYPNQIYRMNEKSTSIGIRIYYKDDINYYFYPVRKNLTNEQRNKIDNVLHAYTTGTLISPIDNKGEISKLKEAASSAHYAYDSKRKCGSSKTVKRSNCDFHGGNDYSVSCNTKVYAVDGGVVTYIRSSSSGGIGKTIAIESIYAGKKYLIIYQHLNSINVKLNQNIKQGDYIAKSGNTGKGSNGKKYPCHLHLEILKSNDINKYKLSPSDSKNPYRKEQYRINPWDYIAGSKKGKNYFTQ